MARPNTQNRHSYRQARGRSWGGVRELGRLPIAGADDTGGLRTPWNIHHVRYDASKWRSFGHDMYFNFVLVHGHYALVCSAWHASLDVGHGSN